MKMPSLRISKWLGDIPVEGYCSSCSDIQFKAQSTSHRPTRAQFQRSIQGAFDAHLKSVHLGEVAAQADRKPGDNK
jgi:hypothetical protein